MNLIEIKEQSVLEAYEINQIEQVPGVEAQGGIAIRGLSAEVEPKGKKKINYVVTILGEVEILSDSLKRSVEIMAVCYGDRGQVCGSQRITFFAAGEAGGAAINHEIECKSPPVKVRVFPKIWA